MNKLNCLSQTFAKNIYALVAIVVLLLIPFVGGEQYTLDNHLYEAKVVKDYGTLPLHFEMNRGQTAEEVDFLARGSGYQVFLKSSEMILSLTRPAISGNDVSDKIALQRTLLGIQLLGANPKAIADGQDELPGRTNYFRGSNPAGWLNNIPNFARVKYEDIYPGIDLVYYGNQHKMEYDFVVSPGANPEQIQFEVKGVESMQVSDSGDLNLYTSTGLPRLNKPYIYQNIEGEVQEIDGGYVLADNHQVSFQIGDYDSEKPLVIDPVIEYSTFLGSNGTDIGFDIAVDANGNAYIVGSTNANDFPTTSGAFDEQGNKGGFSEPGDVFVTKINPDGSALVYSTYLSGSEMDTGYSIAVDADGNAYITGETFSVDDPNTAAVDEGFPLMNPHQGSYGGNGDLFVAKLDSSGSALAYSTYLGGSELDRGDTSQDQPGIAVDAHGNAYVAGTTQSANFPTTNGAFSQNAPGPFVAKYDSAGSALEYSTFLGGNTFVFVWGVAVDNAGHAYVTGFTGNPNLPTTVGSYQPARIAQEEAFVIKVNSDGSDLDYATYLGGSSDDFGFAITVDKFGNAYITGETFSADYPNTVGSTRPSGPIVTKLNAAGSALDFSVVNFGGDVGYDIAVDGASRVFITGHDRVGDDTFFTMLSDSGTQDFETFLGGTFRDIGYGIAVDNSGNAYITGQTSSASFPGDDVVNQNPFQPNIHSVPDAFVVKIDLQLPPPVIPIITNVSPLTGGQGTVVTITGQNFGQILSSSSAAKGNVADLNPDDLCVVIMDGDRSIPLQALTATDTEITAELGFVPPDAQPGPIAVGLGKGVRGFFEPFEPGVIVEEPVWVWNRTGGMGFGKKNFIPIPSVSADTCKWFFGRPKNGKICVTLDCDWPDSAKVQIAARAHDHTTGVGHDLTIFSIRILEGGNAFKCAKKICDAVKQAFWQQAQIDVDCNADSTKDGAKITLSLPNGSIDWGNLNICILEGKDFATGIADDPLASIPETFLLHQNYPNPFNPSTTIRYDLPAQVQVRLTIFDVLGRTVRTLVEQKQPAGVHSVVWDSRDDRGRQLASGLYVYRLEAGDFRKTAKMLLLK